MMRNRVSKLDITAKTGAPFVPFLRKHLAAARRSLAAPLRELAVVLVGDKQMSELHERFMQITGPTDVLTFPIETDSRNRPLSGEVVVCVPEARRAAKIHGTDVQNEVLLYAIHGMLHLCGFDDRTESAFRKMHAKEDQILMRLGVGRVFEPSPPPGHRTCSRRSPMKTSSSAAKRRRRTGAR